MERYGPVLTAVLGVLAGAHAVATFLWCRRAAGRGRGGTSVSWVVVLCGAVVSAVLCGGVASAPVVGAVAAVVGVLWAAVRPLAGVLHLPGYLLVASGLTLRLALLLWWGWLLLETPVRPVGGAVLTVWAVFGLLRVPSVLLDAYFRVEVLCRERWARPRAAPTHESRRGHRVSVHVPCCAEPPDVVKATLDALAAQRYDDFEVLVIDNNTRDPALWRPVAEHCRTLGKRFRFFHVDRLEGAKAGALNYALERTSARAEVIAVVDADYQARPDFLSRLTGAFQDPSLGFVQTRHDYRDWQASPYLTGCYFEYRLMYGTYLVSRNELRAPIIAGTMCLIRRQALEAVGGWAQWCNSEDSELALRIHAAGYTSLYFDQAFGHGLIPETFRGYKRQRARWIHGPTQELRRHWRLFLPGRLAAPSRMRGAHKVLHAHHGVREALRAAHTAASLPLAAFAVALAGTHAPVSFDMTAAVATALFVLCSAAQQWTVFRRVLGATPAQTLRAWYAQASLDHVTWVAALACWWTGRRPWLRTSKFKAGPQGMAALHSTYPEITVCALWLAAALSVLISAGITARSAALCALLFLPAAKALCSPLMALHADRCLTGHRIEVPRQRISPDAVTSTQTDSFTR